MKLLLVEDRAVVDTPGFYSGFYYRFDYDSFQDGNGYLKLHSFPIVRRTPKGVWLNVWGQEKFVLKDCRKKYAAGTIEEALKSFIARKERQVLILKKQLDSAERALAAGRLEERQKEHFEYRHVEQALVKEGFDGLVNGAPR